MSYGGSRRGDISMQIQNYEEVLDFIRSREEAGKKAISRTIGEIKKRAPSWIASAVTEVYTINKKEITPGSTKKVNGEKVAVKQAGHAVFRGETLDGIKLVYSGRRLTPVHFKMTPKAPTGKSYTITMEVIKGHKRNIGRYENTRTRNGPYSQRSHNILMGTGNTQSDGVNYIPFQRVSTTRTDLKKLTTVSVPQMVENEQVSARIFEIVGENIDKRLKHNLERALGS